MKRLLFVPAICAAMLLSGSPVSAEVRCFKDTESNGVLMIDYGRSMVKWGDWISAQITETWVRWNITNRLSVDHYSFDRYTFDVTQRREYNEDVNARNFTNRFSFRKAECQKPPDLE